MKKTISNRIDKLNKNSKAERKTYALLTYDDGSREILRSMEVSFCWLCGVVRDERGKLIVNMQILADGLGDKGLEIASQFVNENRG